MSAVHTDPRLDAFLREQVLHPDRLDAGAILADFLAGMERGLRGEPSSLAMIPSYVPVGAAVPDNVPVAVVDAGGTNLRTALVEFQAGRPQVRERKGQRMPGTAGEVPVEAFFDAVAEALRPAGTRLERIGFCFSYPATITPDCDGVLLRMVKELRIAGLAGAPVGARLVARLRERGFTGAMRLTLANDTITTLLAGAAQGGNYATFIGFILGTGTNCAYVERNEAIVKAPGLATGGRMAINIESGNFNRFPRGPVDLAYDATMANPGVHVLEKAISGGYLGGLVHHALRAAAGAGLLSDSAAAALAAAPLLETRELEALLVPGFAGEPAAALRGLCTADLAACRQVADAVVERAAILTAVNLAGPVLKSGAGRDGERPVAITADGSTYHKLPGFKARVDRRLRALLSGDRRRAFEILAVDDAPLLGAAVAGLVR